MLNFRGLRQTKIFFWFLVVQSQMPLHFLGAGHRKLQPKPEKLCFAIKTVFPQAPQQTLEELLSKSFSINFARLNLDKQWPVEVAVHVAALKVWMLLRKLWLGGHLWGHDVWDHLQSMQNPSQRISGLQHKRHILLLEEVYITKST